MSKELMRNKIKNAMQETGMAKKLNEQTNYKFDKTSRNYVSKQYSNLLLYLLKSGKFVSHPILFLKVVMQSDLGVFKKKIIHKITWNAKT